MFDTIGPNLFISTPAGISHYNFANSTQVTLVKKIEFPLSAVFSVIASERKFMVLGSPSTIVTLPYKIYSFACGEVITTDEMSNSISSSSSTSYLGVAVGVPVGIVFGLALISIIT